MIHMTHPAQTKKFLEQKLREKGLWLNKKLGQCFLIDINMLKSIVRLSGVDKDSSVLEVGCGSGMLTQFLARSAGLVWAVEVDDKLMELAREMLKDVDNVIFISDSIMAHNQGINPKIKQMLKNYLDENPGKNFAIVANLPYYLATSFIMEMFEEDLPLQSMTLTVQKEVADRLMAKPAHKSYNAVSVIAQVNARIYEIKILKPNLFWPRPRVCSSVVKIIPDKILRSAISDYSFFRNFVKAVFLYRRKRIKSALKYARNTGEEDVKTLEANGFDLNRRAEEFPVKELIQMSNVVNQENEDHSFR